LIRDDHKAGAARTGGTDPRESTTASAAAAAIASAVAGIAAGAGCSAACYGTSTTTAAAATMRRIPCAVGSTSATMPTWTSSGVKTGCAAAATAATAAAVT
jgi:hypothetical protein